MIVEPQYPPRIHHPILSGETPRRIKLTIEYDGTEFKGWQVQSGERAGEGEFEGENAPARTVQGAVERALRKITGLPIRIAGASRTDAGVHARGQVASLLLPGELAISNHQLCMALNSNMDKDVNVVSVEDAPLDVLKADQLAIEHPMMYNLWQRMRSNAAGERYEAEHGSIHRR